MNVLNQTHFDCGSRWVKNKTRNAWANGPEIAAARARGVKAKDIQEAYGISYPTLRRIIEAQEAVPAAQPVPSDREVELQGHIDAMRKERAEMVSKHKAELEMAAQKLGAAAHDLAAIRARVISDEALAEQNNDQLQKDLAHANEVIAARDRRIELVRDMRKEADRKRRKAEAELARAHDEILGLHREIQTLKGMNQSTMNWQKEASDEYQRRVTAEADRKAAEAQLELMAERLTEIRNRGFWGRVFG